MHPGPDVKLSSHLAAGVATLLFAIPLAMFLNGTEQIGVGLTTAVLALVYIILFVIYRALGDAQDGVSERDGAGIWIALVSGIAAIVAGIAWSVWVWLMARPLTAFATYMPLLAAFAVLWVGMALGAFVQTRTRRHAP